AEPVPVLPVEVVAPSTYADGQRLVGVAENGDEIIYEGDAALGKPAAVDRSRHAPEPAREKAENPKRVPPISARATHVPTRSDPAGDAAGADYRTAVELVKSGKTTEAVAALRAF